MRRGLVCFQSKEHDRDAEEVIDFGSAHALFDELTQRASNCIASPPSSDVTTATTLAPAVSPESSVYSDKASVKSKEMFTRDTYDLFHLGISLTVRLSDMTYFAGKKPRPFVLRPSVTTSLSSINTKGPELDFTDKALILSCN
ncbi:hypothetical protein F2Q68_00040165 [Brassica cretica]|nr:hypothetical protein F2Q68_00040165 [Brassica cretica]